MRTVKSTFGKAERKDCLDSLRDQVLCVELKMLYVAMTRARKRCFVYDSSTERRAPLFYANLYLLPSIICSLFSLLTFFLHPTVGDRLGYCITLNLALQFSKVSKQA